VGRGVEKAVFLRGKGEVRGGNVLIRETGIQRVLIAEESARGRGKKYGERPKKKGEAAEGGRK